MWLLKTRGENLEGVVKHGKHATNRWLAAGLGDHILIAETKATLAKGAKRIRYAAEFEACREDKRGESIIFWHRPFKYMIDLRNLREIEPFDLKDVQVSQRNYGIVRDHCRMAAEDEEMIAQWIGKS